MSQSVGLESASRFARSLSRGCAAWPDNERQRRTVKEGDIYTRLLVCLCWLNLVRCQPVGGRATTFASRAINLRRPNLVSEAASAQEMRELHLYLTAALFRAGWLAHASAQSLSCRRCRRPLIDWLAGWLLLLPATCQPKQLAAGGSLLVSVSRRDERQPSEHAERANERGKELNSNSASASLDWLPLCSPLARSPASRPALNSKSCASSSWLRESVCFAAYSALRENQEAPPRRASINHEFRRREGHAQQASEAKQSSVAQLASATRATVVAIAVVVANSSPGESLVWRLSYSHLVSLRC